MTAIYPEDLPDEDVERFALGGSNLAQELARQRGLVIKISTKDGLSSSQEMCETIVETPWGKMSYSGELTEKTMLTLPTGQKIAFYSLISRTNGACLPYFVEPKHTK